MDRIHVSTVVYLPRPEVYDFLVEFPRYARYSKYLRGVDRYGDGSPGTEYDLNFAWWKLAHTVRSRVTGVDPPERIDWELVSGAEAHGSWVVEPAPEAAERRPGAEAASRIHLRAAFDPDSVDADDLGLPGVASMDWVLAHVKPLAVKEAKRVVARAVRDIEGAPRQIELVVEERPDVL